MLYKWYANDIHLIANYMIMKLTLTLKRWQLCSKLLKKIEAIINRKNYPSIREKLDALGIDIIDKRNLEDSRFTSQSKGSRVGGSVVRSTMLAKIELAMSDKLAREVVDIISENSGLPKSIKSKFLSLKCKKQLMLILWKESLK